MLNQAPVLFVGYNQTLAAKLAQVFGYDHAFPLFDPIVPIAHNIYQALLVCTDTTAWEFAVEQLAQRGEFVVVVRIDHSGADQEIFKLGAKQVIDSDASFAVIRKALEAVGLLGKQHTICPVIATTTAQIFGGVVVSVRAQLVSAPDERFSLTETLRRNPRTAVYVTVHGIVPPHPDNPFHAPMLAKDFVPMWQAPSATFGSNWSLCLMLESGEAPCGLKDARALFAVLLKAAFCAAWGVDEPKLRLEFIEIWTDPGVEEGTEES